MRDEDIKTASDKMRIMFEEFNISVLDDSRLFGALFNDFVNFDFDGKEILISSIRTPVLSRIKDICNSSNKENEVKKLEYYLDTTLGLKEDWINFIIEIYSSALGWGVTLPKQNNTASYVPPKTLAAPQKIKLNSIFLFAYDGSDYDNVKYSGPVFMKDETQYVGVKVTFDSPEKEIEGTFKWQIFRDDGTPFTDPIILTDTILPTHSMYHSSWGWKDKGNWPEGAYKVVASLNGSNEMVAYFNIEHGSYHKVNMRINSVRLFSADNTPPEIGKRSYSKVFSKETTKRIFFELSHKVIKNTFYTTVNYTIRNSHSEIVGNFAVPIQFMNGWDMCWVDYGYDEAGLWDSGLYSYEVSIGNGPSYYGYFSIT